MTSTSFLDRIASELIENYKHDLTNTIVVLPNKRAKIFLLDALRQKVRQTIFAPEIISIEEFIEQISGIRSIDAITLLFEFYEVYMLVTEKTNQQPFEQFANWAKTLLQDFNEIDRYLLEPDKILKYLDDIKEIEHWSVDTEKRTDLIQRHLEFWKLLPKYYHSLYEHLVKKELGYQGMIYREAVKKADAFSKSGHSKHYLFAGFNALNAAEENIIQQLIYAGQARIFWDAEQTFLNDSSLEAGLFLRRYKQHWRYYKTHEFQWISNEFTSEKNIRIIGTPKNIGQVNIAGEIVEQLLQKPNFNINKTAIVLGEENLLIPLIYALPAGVENLNITMGYSGKSNPVQLMVAKLFKLHIAALSRSQYVFYYKDLLDVLTHPLVEPYVQAHDLVQRINQQNYTFITHKKAIEIQGESNRFLELVLHPWENNAQAILNTVLSLLEIIKDHLNNDHKQDLITKTFLYALFKTINKLISYTDAYPNLHSPETLHSIYKQIIDLTEVSFEGEPLSGLQVMGVLESRVLDFETVIVLSMNEGKFPAGKSQNSFIPYDVKMEFCLPTFKEKDAIYTYHFYHLLQRAKDVYLIYNTESDGIDAGEKSRFITQLEIEKQPNHTLTQEIYNTVLPETVYVPMVIPKSESVLQRLKEIAEKGFSPSALTGYIRNPMDFYFKRILRIGNLEEVEENIALNTLGTIIHETLRVLYEPFIGKFVSENDLFSCLNQLDDEVLKQFKIVYKEGEIKKGRNLLAFEVAKRHVYNFLQLELESLRSGDSLKIIALEETYSRVLEHPDLPYPVVIGGNVDRIELRNGRIRIIDYKTGKVEKRNVSLSTWDALTQDHKNDKIIQVLAYAYMYQEKAAGLPIEVGIVSFKNLKSGFLPFSFKADKEAIFEVNDQILTEFTAQIVVLLQEILNPEIPFEEKI
ncbi:PD-(D/E)XK nuclease family protein [Flavobacterium sp. CYK-4]|uniref:PD-(D/E)XK nuclease family protein n=1 Tax=Flavobacterium lotistagni TaxID=2709660 RepID=UPI00140E7B20|nr:PD-(D/E)XK nuclease family protein [Flavobacterium lotistagni]NHM06012.1 PD-(D/E)XK nuclease family protein [Flavobacterium lotistagni]